MILSERDRQEVQNRLKAMKDPVTLVCFTQKIAGACRTCNDTEQLLKEVAPLSDRLSLEIRNFVTDTADVEKYRIDKIPAVVPKGDGDPGIRIYGIPSGYEFMTLLETVLAVSSRESGLTTGVKSSLKTLDQPVHLQVFVTPTCPYCPRAALTGIRMALESDWVTCDVVEITEFPHLAQRYAVMGVPKTVLNNSKSFEGALPENLFIEQVLQAVREIPKIE
jgi:glutaredoxin-like protein